jgi:threonine dehydrogenase-like Zn-dependent dehydrogenase
VLSETLLIEVPDHVPTDIAALTEPLAVAYRTVAKAQLGPDDVPLVVGCGPIGLAVISVLRMGGDRPIVAADLSKERRELAQRQCLVCGPELKVYFETASSSVRAWSIWSYAYVAMAAVVIVSPLRASDS